MTSEWHIRIRVGFILYDTQSNDVRIVSNSGLTDALGHSESR